MAAGPSRDAEYAGFVVAHRLGHAEGELRIDGCELGKRAVAGAVRPVHAARDAVANLDAVDIGADLHNLAREVAADDGAGCRDELHMLPVRRILPSGAHLHEHFIGRDGGAWMVVHERCDVTSLGDDCLHGMPLSRAWRWVVRA